MPERGGCVSHEETSEGSSFNPLRVGEGAGVKSGWTLPWERVGFDACVALARSPWCLKLSFLS